MKKYRISTGLEGLDSILNGGLISHKAYLIQGGPGTGKSTFGYTFLQNGLQNGESCLLITLGESQLNILANAQSQNIDLTGATILDLSPTDEVFVQSENYSIFPAADVDTESITTKIIDTLSKHKPDRVVMDSINLLQYLTRDNYQYRNLAISFIRYVCSTNATLILISESYPGKSLSEAEFLVDGIINLIYSPDWRRLNIKKFRGSGFQPGDHTFTTNEHGISVFPKLRPNEYGRSFKHEMISSGIGRLDSILNGGIEKGTVTIITGPTGVGKTNLGIKFAAESARNNQRSVIYTFEEATEILIHRSRLIGFPIDDLISTGKLEIRAIEPFSISPDEFSYMVRNDIDDKGTSLVMIDSIEGHRLSIREDSSIERLQALCVYLGHMGVTTLLINETTNISGEFVTTGMQASFLADNILFLRYLEIGGELRKAVGVLKKRLSDFEKTISEYQITSQGIVVGKKLDNVKGIMSGLAEVVNTPPSAT